MKALRLFAGQKPQSFLLHAAFLFFFVSALTFPLFADEREDLTKMLGRAIFVENIAEVTRLLEAGADPNGIYNAKDGETFLMHAANTTNVALARLLIDHGADINAVNLNGRGAVFAKERVMIELLISYGARFDVVDKNGISPLRPQRFDKRSLAILILEWEQAHSPDFSARFGTRKDYLTDVLSDILIERYLGEYYKEETYTLIERLLEAGADPAAPYKEGFPVAYLAVRKETRTQVFVPMLIEHGAPVDALNKDGETALYCAVENNNIDLASLLLKRGADPNQRCKSGETALMVATSKKAVDLLISSGANLNLQDNKGKTALMKIDKREPASALFQAGADPSIKDNNGRTVLFKWNYSFINPLFDELISRGCNINEPDNEGYTPLIVAASFSGDKRIRFFLEKGADPNYHGPKGRNALHVYLLEIEKDAKWNSNLDFEEGDKIVVTALLEAGTRPTDKDNDGDSALLTATRISRKRKKMVPLMELVQGYANEKEIKVATAEARRTVKAEGLDEKVRNVVLISLPIMWGGASALSWEASKGNQSNNVMVNLNSGVTLGAGGLFLGAMMFGGGGNWAGGLFGGFLGGIAGFIAGLQPSVSNAFATPVMYYFPVLIFGIIAVYKIIWD